jgi:hypothetical protein
MFAQPYSVSVGRMLKFKIHFNPYQHATGKPESMTVHNSRGCFQGEKVVLEVPVETVFRPEGSQPELTLPEWELSTSIRTEQSS